MRFSRLCHVDLGIVLKVPYEEERQKRQHQLRKETGQKGVAGGFPQLFVKTKVMSEKTFDVLRIGRGSHLTRDRQQFRYVSLCCELCRQFNRENLELTPDFQNLRYFLSSETSDDAALIRLP